MAKQQHASGGSPLSLPPDHAEPDPAYRAVLDWVWSFSARPRSPDEIVGQRAVKLDRMRALLAALDDPQRVFESLLVAGTKGKGSTVAMLAACLHRGGLRTGRYTSPHLVNWRERTWVDGEPISPAEVLALADRLRGAVGRLPVELGQPTTFEVGTAFTLAHFAQRNVQVAVLECGVGGRYDATNVVEPLVSVITPISYDHTATLGSTLSSIANHKAGILRPRQPAVLGRQPDEARQVVQRIARELHAPLDEIGREWRWSEKDGDDLIESRHSDAPPLRTHVGLLGAHQRDNAAAAVAALYWLRKARSDLAPSHEAVQAGLSSVQWPGRLQVLSSNPLLILDGAHNAFSAQVLRDALRQGFRFERLLLVLGLSEGKDAHGVLSALAPRASRLYFTRSHHERSADPRMLAELAYRDVPDAHPAVYDELVSAVQAAVRDARPGDAVLVTGSLFLVGEALVWWQNSRR
ncbi:MAG TPA: folylpolyglutamate synthase/dihydrofolate synthase family protein [Chloroflexota bacterium]|nr:folylpolyglutamate synthase/dihydrofolate synthase family protein [Chloroflexota bacterium]